MENNRQRRQRSVKVCDDELDEIVNEEVLDRLRAGVGKILIPMMKEGRAAGRKWVAEDATFEQLWRIAEHSGQDYVNLDKISDTRPLYSFSEPSLGDIIGSTTPETLENLIDPTADEDQRETLWERCGNPSYPAWFALGFIHGAAEVFARAIDRLH